MREGERKNSPLLSIEVIFERDIDPVIRPCQAYLCSHSGNSPTPERYSTSSSLSTRYPRSRRTSRTGTTSPTSKPSPSASSGANSTTQSSLPKPYKPALSCSPTSDASRSCPPFPSTTRSAPRTPSFPLTATTFPSTFDTNFRLTKATWIASAGTVTSQLSRGKSCKCQLTQPLPHWRP